MPREMPSAATRVLARRLLAVTQAESSRRHDSVVINVTEQLRAALTKFAGADSFTSILQRSLALARAELPGLEGITVAADGRLQGLNSRSVGASAQADREEIAAAVAIVSNLLWLLSTFIGLPFTIRLIQNAWPAISLDPYQSGAEEEA